MTLVARKAETRPAGPTCRWLSLAMTTLYGIVLFWTTHTHRLRTPNISVGPVPSDKLIHFLAYALLAILAGITASAWGWSSRRSTVRLILVLTLIAACDEATQLFFARATEFWDWVADTGGVMAGVIFSAVLRDLAFLCARRYGR